MIEKKLRAFKMRGKDLAEANLAVAASAFDFQETLSAPIEKSQCSLKNLGKCKYVQTIGNNTTADCATISTFQASSVQLSVCGQISAL